MDIDRDGHYRPRAGLRFIADMGGDITHVSRPGGYNHRLMVVANGGTLFDVDVEAAGSPTTVDTGWPTGALVSCICSTVSGQNVWIACKSPIGGSTGQVYKYDLTSLSALAPPDGNYVGMHGDICMRIASGDGSTNAIRWSNLGDADTWPVQFAKGPLPELVTVDAIVPMSASESLLIGPMGVGHVVGRDPNNLAWEPLAGGLIATPMTHVCKCRDRVILCGAGPTIYQYVSPGVLQPISAPLYRDLFLAQGTGNLRAWFDPVRNYYCLADYTQFLVYHFSIDASRWVGATVFASPSVNFIGQANIDQGASAFDAASQPWGKAFVGAGNRLSQWDPALYVDQLDDSTSAPFLCAVETQTDIGGDPGLEKQLNSIQVDGSGTFNAFLKWRNPVDGSWATVSLGAVTAPGKLYAPLSSVVYRERTIRLQANSSSTLRFRSMEIDEDPIGVPD